MVDKSEVLRCPHCCLNQYLTQNGHCRRCRGELTVAQAEAPQPVISGSETSRIGEAVRLVFMAHRAGLTQLALARKIGRPRSYIIRIERGRLVPGPKALAMFAAGFAIPTWRLVWEIECMAVVLSQIGGV